MRDVVVTRVPRIPPRSSRNALERLMVRFPSVYRGLAAVVERTLRPRSRLRRSLLLRVLESGWNSLDRRDFELNVLFFTSDVELESPAELQTLGLDPVYRGTAGRVEALRMWLEAWEFTEMTPAFMVDLGDRVLTLGYLHSQALASGVDLKRAFSQLITVRDGLAARDHVFFSWAEGLEAAGLEPDGLVPS